MSQHEIKKEIHNQLFSLITEVLRLEEKLATLDADIDPNIEVPLKNARWCLEKAIRLLFAPQKKMSKEEVVKFEREIFEELKRLAFEEGSGMRTLQ